MKVLTREVRFYADTKNCKTRRVSFGIFPYVRITGLKKDAYGDKCHFRHVEAEGNAQQKSKKGGAKGSVALLNGSAQLGCVAQGFLFDKFLFYMNLECWDRNTPSNSPKNSDKTTFFSPLEAKVIAAPKAQGGIAHSCSSGFVGES